MSVQEFPHNGPLFCILVLWVTASFFISILYDINILTLLYLFFGSGLHKEVRQSDFIGPPKSGSADLEQCPQIRARLYHELLPPWHAAVRAEDV